MKHTITPGIESINPTKLAGCSGGEEAMIDENISR